MENAKLIIPQLVSLDEPLGADKDSVIAALATKIAFSGRAEQNGLINDLMSREAKSTTGMLGGIAIPHCRSQAVRVDSLAFARLKEPVDFGAKDGPADLVFMIAAGEGQERAHLKLLQKLASKLVDKNFLAALRAADSAEKVADIIMGVVAPPAVAAPKSVPAAQTAPVTKAAPADREALAAINDPQKLIREAMAKEKEVKAAPVTAAEPRKETKTVGWGRRIQKAVMAGVSYMIPFLAAGGLLVALGYLIGGYDVEGPAQDISLNFSLWNLPDSGPFGEGRILTNRSGLALYLGALLVFLGKSGMSFLVPALSGYISYGLAGRPGIAPGFIGGAISMTLGAGFIGGLVTGILAGIIANALSTLKCPRWLAGLMPVAIVPLITTLLMGLLMLMLIGHPLAALMSFLQTWLNSMGGTSAILLGIIIGLMMCFDLGGPVNKAVYLVGTAGLAQATDGSYQFMAAVMLSGMVPPLAMALSSTLRPRLYSPAEQQNGKAAWLLGLSFIAEGAVPFAAADPLRVIPSIMAGGAVTGAIAMAFGVGCRAPHGGIFVLFAYTNILGALIALVAGVAVAAAAVTFAKMRRKQATVAKA